MAARFPEISEEEVQKLAEKAVNKNTVKTSKAWMNVWKSWAESNGLNDDIDEYEAKELYESRDFLPKFLKAMAPIMSWAV